MSLVTTLNLLTGYAQPGTVRNQLERSVRLHDRTHGAGAMITIAAALAILILLAIVAGIAGCESRDGFDATFTDRRS